MMARREERRRRRREGAGLELGPVKRLFNRLTRWGRLGRCLGRCRLGRLGRWRPDCLLAGGGG